MYISVLFECTLVFYSRNVHWCSIQGMYIGVLYLRNVQFYLKRMYIGVLIKYIILVFYLKMLSVLFKRKPRRLLNYIWKS